jgi:hypothetical protein
MTISRHRTHRPPLPALKGKNVMIIFPRSYAAENYWCTICNYKYAELIEQGK